MQVLLFLSCFCWALAAFCAALFVPPVWDSVARKYLNELTPTLDALGLGGPQIARYLRWWGIAMFATLAFLIILQMYPLIVPALYLVYIAPRLILNSQVARRRTLLRDQMVGASVALANTTRAGLSLAQGIDSVRGESPVPLANELNRIMHDYKRGLTLQSAITATKERIQIESFTLFTAAVLTCLERGGRITDALERLSRSLQENQRIERKIESETASGRKVVRLLAIFPLFFLVLFSVIYPEGTLELFRSTAGQCILAGVGLLVYFSVRWSNKILNLDF